LAYDRSRTGNGIAPARLRPKRLAMRMPSAIFRVALRERGSGIGGGALL